MVEKRIHKGKKAQVTIFIILAILIVASAVFFFILRDKTSNEMGLSPNAERIYNFVEQCIEDTGNEIVYEVGQGGGYYFPPNFVTPTGIPYFYANEKNYMPSKEQIENEISYHLRNRLFFCTRNFVDFSDYEIEQGKIKPEVEILDEEVVLNVKYPLSIKKGEETSAIENFELKIPVRFGIVYDSIEEIISEDLKGNGICLSCLYDISMKEDLYVEMLDFDEETVVFIFRDENSKINDADFEFVYANEY